MVLTQTMQSAPATHFMSGCQINALARPIALQVGVNAMMIAGSIDTAQPIGSRPKIYCVYDLPFDGNSGFAYVGKLNTLYDKLCTAFGCEVDLVGKEYFETPITRSALEESARKSLVASINSLPITHINLRN